MKSLKPQPIDIAPAGSRESLRTIQRRFGFVPNLLATFASSPAVLNGYLALSAAWEKSSFTATEQRIILLAVSVENKCRYCAAVHATALKEMRVDGDVIAAIRNRLPLADSRLDALVTVTRELVLERGLVSEDAKRAFFAAGYDAVALMEILVGVALATMTNYLDHLSPVSIDPAFQAEARR